MEERFLSILPDVLCPRIILGEDGIEKNALGLSVHLLKAHENQIYKQKKIISKKRCDFSLAIKSISTVSYTSTTVPVSYSLKFGVDLLGGLP
jgi:hypothetical protein